MLDELCVKDVFIKIDKDPNILANAPIGEAIHMMHHELEEKNKYRTILVMDDDDHLQGYLSVFDLIRAVGSDYLQKNRPDVKSHQPYAVMAQDMSALALIWQEGFSLKMHDELAKPVSEYITQTASNVSLEDPIAKCLYLMLFADGLIIPVVEVGEVVGVVRMIDLFNQIADDVEQVWYPKQQKR